MALLFRSDVDPPAWWGEEIGKAIPDLDFRVWPDVGDPAEIEFALVWRPEPGLLAGLPKLRAIFSLGAGVDHLFSDPDLPMTVPITRVVDENLTARMSEWPRSRPAAPMKAPSRRCWPTSPGWNRSWTAKAAR